MRIIAESEKREGILIRIATGGTGNLPQGDLHPDLVNRIADEASRTAQMMLTMAIRAFDYLPPVDVTFGDYLRAFVTADYELFPQDDLGRRVAVINAFRNRGIFPRTVPSLAEESLLWEENEGNVPDLPVENQELMKEFLSSAAGVSRHMFTTRQAKSTPSEEWTEKDRDVAVSKAVYPILHDWVNKNRECLLLRHDLGIQVLGFHPVYRVAPDGRLLIEYVAQFAQRDDDRKKELGGLPFRGGTTIVAGVDGRVRYVIAKPIDTSKGSPRAQEANARLEAQAQYLQATDALDSLFPYASDAYLDNRMALRMNLAALHGGAG